MADFTIRAGNLLPAIPARLSDENGNALNLTGATVTFKLVARNDNTIKVNRAATVLVADPSLLTSATQPNVQYSWQAGDTDTPGLYIAEWVITYTALSASETAPNDVYMTVSITRPAGT